jgi:hypothetical protein
MRIWPALLVGVLLFLVLLEPCPVLADAGTPLMWAGFAHLTVGNAIIGVFEGLLLAWLFKLGPLNTVPIMILANYFSMGVGLLALPTFIVRFGQRLMGPAPLYAAPRVIILLAFLTYGASILLEWPFCFWIMSRGKQRARRSLYASCLAQTASYVLLIPFYLGASGVTLYTGLRLDPSLSFVSNKGATIYFISTKNGDVYQVHPDWSGYRKVCAPHIRSADARLFFRRSSTPRSWDLWVAQEPSAGSRTRLLCGIVGQAAASGRRSAQGAEEGTWFNFGPADDLRSGARSDWEVATGFWPVEGLRAWNKRTKEKLNAALETPFVSWPSRNATVLPGDQIVYQLDDQIVALDIRTRRIGLLALGRGPVVIMQ